MSDYIRRASGNRNANEEEVERVWLVVYTCLCKKSQFWILFMCPPPPHIEQFQFIVINNLAELCIDPRPPVRKSACDTLLQTVAAHGHALKSSTWSQMVWKVEIFDHS